MPFPTVADIGSHDTPLEAGPPLATKLDSGIGFIGRKALPAQLEAGRKRRLLTFVFEDSETSPHGNEPIYVLAHAADTLPARPSVTPSGEGLPSVGLRWEMSQTRL